MKRLFVGAVTVLAVGCGGAPPPQEPGPPADHLVRRHWDQVCQTGWYPDGLVRVDELFDTLGLGATLEDEGLRPPTRAGVERSAHFMTHYDRSGRPTRSGIWESTESDADVAALEALLQARTKELPGLLAATGFHAVLTLTPWPRMEVGAPVECLPHMVHRGSDPPVGVPDTVRVAMGSAYVREGDTRTAGLEVTVDPAGKVTEVRDGAGHPSTQAEARRILRDFVFEPALRNGVPVPMTVRLRFWFGSSAAGRSRSP